MVEHASTGSDKGRSYNGDYMAIGKTGEQIVLDYLARNPAVLDVVDMRDLQKIQEADVDCAIRFYSGAICLAEIKTDTHLGVSGNILNEVFRINHTAPPRYAGYLGWTLRSPAEFLLYYAPARTPRAIYKTTFSAMRLVLQRYTKQNSVRFTEVRTDRIKTTYNVLIPEKEYAGVFKIYELPSDAPTKASTVPSGFSF